MQFGTKSSPNMDKTTFALSTDGAADDASVSDGSIGSVQSSGTSTPVRDRSPPSEMSSVQGYTPVISRSSSPSLTGSCMTSSTSNSPASFAYRYHQSSSQTLLAESSQATLILG